MSKKRKVSRMRAWIAGFMTAIGLLLLFGGFVEAIRQGFLSEIPPVGIAIIGILAILFAGLLLGKNPFSFLQSKTSR